MLFSADNIEHDLKNHVITIHQDDGAYRHITAAEPGTSIAHFNITTWPGYLCISGDMGCFVFSRLPDMFQFFRSKNGQLGINPGYWAEKIEAESVFGDGVSQFSQAALREAIKDYVEGQLDDTPEDQVEEVADAVLAEIGEVSCQGEAIQTVMGLDTGNIELPEHLAYEEDNHPTGINPADLEFNDFWESRLTEYTGHYLWCCQAIVWAIREYDALKQKEQVA